MKQQITEFFEKNPTTVLKPKQLAAKLSIHDEDTYASLKKLLFELSEEGYLVKEGKRYSRKRDETQQGIVGFIEMNELGEAVVFPKRKDIPPIYIPTRFLGTSMHGDLVEVLPFAVQRKRKKSRYEGQVISVIKRRLRRITGTLKKTKAFYFVVPDVRELEKDIYIPEAALNGAKIGDKVLVGDLVWEDRSLNPEGIILKVIDTAVTLKESAETIAEEFGLPFEFPQAVLDEAHAIGEVISEEELRGRVDMRGKVVMTIDPDDAKDFDDALSVEKHDDQTLTVGIHIADVSHYVARDSRLDQEANLRGNSVYLVGSVIPMLPEKLSNNICSLVPGKDRLTFSVFVRMTPRGRIISHSIAKSVINSTRRFTYDEVQTILETGKGDYSGELLLLNKIALILRKKRTSEGSINFFSEEVRFVLDDQGDPLHVVVKESKDSHKLVEDFMLLANRIVAQEITPARRVKKTALYRVHDVPEEKKMVEFIRFVKTLGYNFGKGKSFTAKDLNELMAQAEGKPEELIVNDLAIRSMAKAVYSITNIGHFGLGFGLYTHFTSPIRRYADLIVHRLLYSYTTGAKKLPYSDDALDQIAEHITATERSAVEAERFSVRLNQIALLKNSLGEEFDGIISGVTNFGFFVKLKETLAEGLVHVRELGDEYYIFDELKYSLIGRKSKITYRLGDTVRVKLIRIDYAKSLLDFIVVR